MDYYDAFTHTRWKIKYECISWISCSFGYSETIPEIPLVRNFTLYNHETSSLTINYYSEFQKKSYS